MLRVRGLWTGVAGSPYYTNLYFAGASQQEAQDAATGMQAAINAFRNSLSDDIIFAVQPEVAVIDPASGNTTAVLTVSGGVTQGSQEGGLLPRATQMLVRLATPSYFAGRNVRGHSFVPGFTVQANGADGRPVASYRESVRAGYATLVGGSTPALVVYSRKNGNFAQVTGVAVSDEWAVLRSRRD